MFEGNRVHGIIQSEDQRTLVPAIGTIQGPLQSRIRNVGFKSQVCHPFPMSLKPPKRVPQPLKISFLFVKLEIMMFFLSACNQQCDVAYMKWLRKPVTTKINYNINHELKDCHKRFYKKNSLLCILCSFSLSPVYVPNPSLGYKTLKATVSILYLFMLFSGLYITNGHSRALLTDILSFSSVPITRIQSLLSKLSFRPFYA